MTSVNASISLYVQQQIDRIADFCSRSKPLVVIRSITYNHVSFLHEALDGFLKQHTDFPFVVVVHDDASTDGTADILRDYAEKHPNIVFPIFENENQHSKHDGSLDEILIQAINATGAKYIALCEGDDYWTDPLKLQKQIDFLESHPDYSMCTHNYIEFFQNNHEFGNKLGIVSMDYDLKSYIRFKEWIYLTLTLVYRRSMLNDDIYSMYGNCRDTTLIYHLLTNGKGFFMHEVMGVYRRHDGGVWTSIGNENNAWDTDVEVRYGIYDVEKSDEAAQFLINSFLRRGVCRRHLIKNYRIVIDILSVYRKHFGFSETLRLFKKRFIDNIIEND